MARKKRTSIIDYFNPELPYVTEFRRLLQKVQNANSSSDLKTLLFTSAMLAEGKSTVCAFLALTASKHKSLKTLLIDCDLRRPAIHRLFAVDRSRGLSEILKATLSPRDAVKKTGVPTLDIITSGEPDAHPAEVFDADAISQLTDEVKFSYDLILLDTAPLLPVSDPMLLAAKTDGVVLVVKAGETQREVVQRAVEVIGNYRDKILGVVLNNMNNALPYYHNYGYFGYDYSPKPERRRGSARQSAPAPRRAGDTSSDKPVKDGYMPSS